MSGTVGSSKDDDYGDGRGEGDGGGGGHSQSDIFASLHH